MKRHPLPPARPALDPPDARDGAGTLDAGPICGGSVSGKPAVRRGKLAAPKPARASGRWLFSPMAGFFRDLRRDVVHTISRDVYPRIPYIDRPYSRQLRRNLTVSETPIALSGLGIGLTGMKALFVSDIHVGPFLSPEALESTFEKLLSLRPDVVFVGGDIATSDLREFAPYAEAFRNLRAPMGVFAVLGNHDHYTRRPRRVRQALEETGARVLHNDSVVLERGGDRLIVAGIDDLQAGEPDLDAALARAAGWEDPGARPPVVLLSHNPDVFFDAARCGVDLVLSGHTHGGQVRVPGLPVLVRQSRYRLDEGRYAVNGSELVVTRGLGADGLPIRVACPPEAILLRFG
jgi:predicted MPP superfamily phosphohydrolase